MCLLYSDIDGNVSANDDWIEFYSSSIILAVYININIRWAQNGKKRIMLVAGVFLFVSDRKRASKTAEQAANSKAYGLSVESSIFVAIIIIKLLINSHSSIWIPSSEVVLHVDIYACEILYCAGCILCVCLFTKHFSNAKW